MRRAALAIVLLATDAGAAEPPITLIAPEKVELLTVEESTRIRVTGSFRACPGGDCGETTRGIVELACVDATPEQCRERSMRLTHIAAERQCVMLALDPKAVHPVDATFVPSAPFRAAREWVAVDADDPLCVHARGPRNVVRPEPAALGADTHPTVRRSYGGYILLNDAISALTLPIGIGFGGYILAGPITHWVNGEAGKGMASLGLRIGLPWVGGLAFTVSCIQTQCGDDALGRLFIGLALGAFAASMMDAALLAHTEDRVGPKVTLAPIGDTRTLGLSLAGWL